jgi:hypothetical protein
LSSEETGQEMSSSATHKPSSWMLREPLLAFSGSSHDRNAKLPDIDNPMLSITPKAKLEFLLVVEYAFLRPPGAEYAALVRATKDDEISDIEDEVTESVEFVKGDFVFRR